MIEVQRKDRRVVTVFEMIEMTKHKLICQFIPIPPLALTCIRLYTSPRPLVTQVTHLLD